MSTVIISTLQIRSQRPSLVKWLTQGCTVRSSRAQILKSGSGIPERTNLTTLLYESHGIYSVESWAFVKNKWTICIFLCRLGLHQESTENIAFNLSYSPWSTIDSPWATSWISRAAGIHVFATWGHREQCKHVSSFKLWGLNNPDYSGSNSLPSTKCVTFGQVS